MDGRRLLGLAFLAFALAGLAGGLAAAAYGQLDEREQQAQPNPSGLRTERNERLLLLGVAAASPAIPLLALGILNAFPQQPRDRPRLAAAAATVLGVSAILIVALALDPLAASREAPAPLAVEAYDGEVASTLQIGPLGQVRGAGDGHAQILLAPGNADRVEARVTWTPAERGSVDLAAVLEVDPGTGWRVVATAEGPSPLLLDAAPADLGNASVQIRVLPANEVDLVVEQPFHVEVQFWR